ncbi:MAG: PEP-CTERM sorting domain-containing protein, partial [Akkermansia sp.]|nr:PEP-CTERM sorting domain-containing protein [Akkermansia sp.]
GEILLSGAYTEADLLAAKNGVAGTMTEINNSRTNTVVGTTTLGGGTLCMEAGAILQTGGFSTAVGSDAQVWLDNAVLNSSGYDVSFGSGTGLVVGGSNSLTARIFTMEEGSYLSFDLRDKNQNLSALSVNANMTLSGLDVVVMNADIMAAGKYKLLTLAEGAQYDTGSWDAAINSVTGVDAASLSWENGTLYYTSTNEWIISVTEDATIIEDTTGKDIVIGNGAELVLNACRQGHPNCDNPKHGGRPGNPGQGHAKPKPGNSGNNGNGNGNGNNKNHDDGDGSLVIVEGSAYIKDRGEFEGLLSFRGSAVEERHFYTEKDLGVAYIAVFTDADATSHLHVVQGKKLETEGIVGDGNLEKHGAGCLVLEGHDADESSTQYFGCLGVQEGSVRVADDSQAYLANTEVNGATNNAAMQVGRGASMTGESLSVSGENATLHNDGSIAMTDGITVDGGTVKGSGTFSGLTMNSGTLVVGNSPGLQIFTDDLVLSDANAVFSVGGFEMVTADSLNGWNAAVYSSIAMNGHDFSIGEGVTITLAFGGAVLDDLVMSTTSNPLEFTLTLVQNVGNGTSFTDDLLAQLAEQTQFNITDEQGGLAGWATGLAGADLSEYVSGVDYRIENGNLMVSGSIAVNGNLVVPEPTTATLSLLALSMLAARRRRQYGTMEGNRKSA